MFTHCWTMQAWGWRRCIFLLARLSSMCCSFSLKADMSSWLFSRKIPLPWFRPVGLQIHIWASLLHTPDNRRKVMSGTHDIDRYSCEWDRSILLYLSCGALFVSQHCLPGVLQYVKVLLSVLCYSITFFVLWMRMNYWEITYLLFSTICTFHYVTEVFRTNRLTNHILKYPTKNYV